MKGAKKSKKYQPKEVKIGFTNNNTSPKVVPKNSSKSSKQKSGIPSYVANRMARRIAFTTGIPTLSGMGVFVGSYFLISKGIAEISPSVTLVISALCFLIGLLGLSYGILSASWDFNPGSFIGLENLKPNINRIKEAFKTNQKDVSG